MTETGKPFPNATATFYEVARDGSAGLILGKATADATGRFPTIRPVYVGGRPSLVITRTKRSR